jgi:hypothetical protein
VNGHQPNDPGPGLRGVAGIVQRSTRFASAYST